MRNEAPQRPSKAVRVTPTMAGAAQALRDGHKPSLDFESWLHPAKLQGLGVFTMPPHRADRTK